MKTHIALTLAALAAFITPTSADTPAAIAADYRNKAETALQRINITLDAEAAKISQTLLALGDAAAVEKLAEQVKAKRAGEPVPQPVPQAAQLFTAYEAARVKALSPVTDSTLRRIETTLASSEGKKTEVVAELAKLKMDVQAGRISNLNSAPPPNWTFHRTRSGPSAGSVVFGPKGDVTFISKVGNKSTGTWTKTKPDTIVAKFPSDEWRINFRKSGTEVRTTSSQEICYLEPVSPP